MELLGLLSPGREGTRYWDVLCGGRPAWWPLGRVSIPGSDEPPLRTEQGSKDVRAAVLTSRLMKENVGR